jgi:hypothetical protein
MAPNDSPARKIAYGNCSRDAFDVGAPSGILNPAGLRAVREMGEKNQEKYPCRTFQQPGHEDRGIEFDKHYSVQQIAEIWGWGVDKVRQIFENEPDVLREGKGDRRSCRRYITLRIPERVVRRVHARRT